MAEITTALPAMNGSSHHTESPIIQRSTAPSSGAQKLGQPVPLSNFVSDENRSRRQPAQPKSHAAFREVANW